MAAGRDSSPGTLDKAGTQDWISSSYQNQMEPVLEERVEPLKNRAFHSQLVKKNTITDSIKDHQDIKEG